MLDSRKAHVKFWRPQILLMVPRPRQSAELVDFINDIKKGGLYVLGNVQIGHLDDFKDKDPISEEYPKWMKLVDRLQIKAFVELTLAKTVPDGLHHLIRTSGLGGMKINTVCFGFFDSAKPVDSLAKWPVRKKRFFGSAETGQYFDVGIAFRGIRHEDEKKDLTMKEYVRMIGDSLKMQKNVMLCRNFTSLNKSAIKSTKGVLYVDVWPVNFFRPETASYFDNTCLFLLQLACIINMVPSWKSRTCLRVFLFVNANTESAVNKEEKLEAYLRQLRILAKIQTVSWESVSHNVVLKEFDMSVNYSECRMQEYNKISPEFLKALNAMIASHSKRSAVTFLYLPRPPVDETLQASYMSQLEDLSENLPPTVFVHGLHPVTSTTL